MRRGGSAGVGAEGGRGDGGGGGVGETLASDLVPGAPERSKMHPFALKVATTYEKWLHGYHLGHFLEIL